jgi:thioester reductase-like protein
MNLFVTGATGIMERILIQQLATRQGLVYVLVCASLRKKIDVLRARLPPQKSARIIPVYGDITASNVGLSANDLAVVKGNVEQFVHSTTLYDANLDAASQLAQNIIGTTNAVQAAQAMKAACFHHISFLAGNTPSPGAFVEESLEEVDILDDPSFRSSNAVEKVIRLHCTIPYKLYRPAAVQRHSRRADIIEATRDYSPGKTLH